MKKNRLMIAFVILVWVMAGLSCRIGPATPIPPTQEVQNVTPPTENIQTITVAPETQATSPSFQLPSGVLVDTMDNVGITFYNAAGQVITELKTDGLQNSSPSEVQLAGTVSGPIMTPLVYHAVDPQRRILININDAVSLMADAPDFYAMRGAPGQSVLVYATVTYNPGNNGITSNLYFGTLAQLTGGGGLVYSEQSNGSFAVYPLAVNAENGLPLGFYFSRQMYGIGDAIFAPQKGLFYYDLASNSVAPVLDETRIPQGISLDHVWVASNAWQGDNSITVQNLNTNLHAYLPILPSSGDGAGFASFSPDDQFIAWMEASGAMMSDTPDFHSVVRVARTDGTLVRDVVDVNFGALVGVPITWVEPMAWLDNSTLLVQARGTNWTDAWVMKLDINSGTPSLFASGSFVGLYYP